MTFCSVDRVNPAHPRATGDCSPDVQASLDSPGVSALAAPERRAVQEVIRRAANDTGLMADLRALLDDPAYSELPAEERSAMARQVAAYPSAETARRLRVLLHDEALQALPRDLVLHEIDSAGAATPPDAGDLARGAGLQGPPRSHPHAWTMLVEGGFELAELGEAGHRLDHLIRSTKIAGSTVLEGAAALVVPVIVALECGDGVRAGISDGREWGRRIAHGAGFAEGIARRLAGSSSDVVPPQLTGQARTYFRSGLRAADTALAELSPSERAALLASGGGTVTEDIRSLVLRRTIEGR